jgi:hypothetical protein
MNLNRSYKIALVVLLAAQNLWAAMPTNNAAAMTNAAAATVDYSTFVKFVADRNIFDPNRRAGVVWTNPPPRQFVTNTNRAPRQASSFSLVGIVGYGEGHQAGAYAFFDGSSQQYRKTVQLNGGIATFKVADIAADSVTLVLDTNKMILRIGQQMVASGGRWLPGDALTANYSTASSTRTSGRGAPPGGSRRNNNFDTGNNLGGGLGGGNVGGRRGGNGFGGGLAPADNRQALDPNTAAPGGIPYNIMTADGILTPDGTLIPYNIVAPDDSTIPANN